MRRLLPALALTAWSSAWSSACSSNPAIITDAITTNHPDAASPADAGSNPGNEDALPQGQDGNMTVGPDGALDSGLDGGSGDGTTAGADGAVHPDAMMLPHDGGMAGDGGCAGIDGACPLSDMGLARYLGAYSGGLYQDGLNDPPAAHIQEGLVRANALTPRNVSGNPALGGKIVMLSIGMSNTSGEFCVRPGWGSAPPNEFVCNGNFIPCTSGSFIDQATNDLTVNHTALTIIDGAFDGQTAEAWTVETPGLDPHMQRNYMRVRDCILGPKGLSEAQVQVVWLKVANPDPTVSLPDPSADVFRLAHFIGLILRDAKVVYPNLQMVFISSRIYGGYANLTGQRLNPEPYAYESGFAVKWVIQAQIDQMASGGMMVPDQNIGDLNYSNGTAPWVAWGPYMWANGTEPRSDGLTWVIGDFANDQTHPSVPQGVTKVGGQLMHFFTGSRFTRCWFLANGGPCS